MDNEFKNNIEFQYELLKQFCQSCNGSYTSYKAEKIPLLSLNDEKCCVKYSSLWHDFVSIRVNLFEIDLKSLLLNQLNCTKDELCIFGKNMKFYRNQCGTLPLNGKKQFDYFKQTTTGINRMNEKYSQGNNHKLIHPIFLYYVIYHGISSLIIGSRAFGWKIKELFGIDENSNKKEKQELQDSEDDSKKFKISRDEICQFLEEYLLNKLAQTGVFGNYASETDFDGYYVSNYDKIAKKTKK